MKKNSRKSNLSISSKKIQNKKEKVVLSPTKTKKIISSPIKIAKKEKKLVKNLKKFPVKKVNIKKKVALPKRVNISTKIVSPKKAATPPAKSTPKRGGMAKQLISMNNKNYPAKNNSRSPVRGRENLLKVVAGKKSTTPKKEVIVPAKVTARLSPRKEVAIPAKVATRTSPKKEVVIPAKIATRPSPKKELAIIIDNFPKQRNKSQKRITRTKSKSNTPTKVIALQTKEKTTPTKKKMAIPVLQTISISPSRSPVNMRGKSKSKKVTKSPVKQEAIGRASRSGKSVDVEMRLSKSPVRVARGSRNGKVLDVKMSISRSPVKFSKQTPPKQVTVSNFSDKEVKKTPPKQKQIKKKVTPPVQISLSRSPVASPRKVEKIKKQKPVSRTPEKKINKSQPKQVKPEAKIAEIPKAKVKTNDKIVDKIKDLEMQKLRDKSAKKEESKKRDYESVRKMPSLSPVKAPVKAIKKASPVRQLQRSPSPVKVAQIKPKVQSTSIQKNLTSVKSEKVIQTPLVSKQVMPNSSTKSKEKQIMETPRSVAISSIKQKEKFETPANISQLKASVHSSKEKKFELPVAVQTAPKSARSKEKTLTQEVRPSSVRSKKKSPEPKITVHKDFKDIVTNIEMINRKKEEEEKHQPKSVAKPRVTVVEKSVQPKKIAAQSTTYKQQSPKISEDKHLFDKNFKRYINLTDINKKTNQITSLEILLSIVEVAQHGQHYNIEHSNRSVQFWRKVSELKFCDNIFNSYRPETIRKYWRFINERQVEKVIAVINRIKTFKEDYNVK